MEQHSQVPTAPLSREDLVATIRHLEPKVGLKIRYKWLTKEQSNLW